MASRLGIERVGYALTESGKRKMTIDRLYIIAEVLEVNVVHLLLGNRYNPDGSPIQGTDPDSPVYKSGSAYERSLEKENELLRKALSDKDEIIRLLKEKGGAELPNA